jgi:hypothetical protein
MAPMRDDDGWPVRQRRLQLLGRSIGRPAKITPDTGAVADLPAIGLEITVAKA